MAEQPIVALLASENVAEDLVAFNNGVGNNIAVGRALIHESFMTSEAVYTRADTVGGAFVNGIWTRFAANTVRYGVAEINDTYKGIIMEIPRSNLLKKSEEIDDALWTKTTIGTGATTPTVTANAGTSPDGTVNADRVVFNCTGGTTSADRSVIIPSCTVTIGDSVARAFSVFMKSFDGTSSYTVDVRIGGVRTTFTVTPTWQRFIVQGTASGDGTIHIGLYKTVDGDTADVLVWGAQVETGGFATTYIGPTSTTAVARSGDFSVIAGVNARPWFSQQYSIFADYKRIVGAQAVAGAVYTTTNAAEDFNDYCQLTQETNSSWQWQSRVAASTVSQKSHSITDNARHKLAGALFTNDFSVAYDGVSSGAIDVSCANPAVTKMNLGCRFDGLQFCGTIKSLLYYKNVRLTEQQLLTLTA